MDVDLKVIEILIEKMNNCCLTLLLAANVTIAGVPLVIVAVSLGVTKTEGYGNEMRFVRSSVWKMLLIQNAISVLDYSMSECEND